MFQLYVEYFELRASGGEVCLRVPLYILCHPMTKRFSKALITLIRFKKYAFSLSSIMHPSIRVHATVLMDFGLSTQKRSKTIELHVVT